MDNNFLQIISNQVRQKILLAYAYVRNIMTVLQIYACCGVWATLT